MTNLVEKIRQVVEETQEYFYCITAQKEAALYAQAKLLDTIIEEITALSKRSEKKAMYTQDEDQTIHAHAVGMTDATYEVLRSLEEARTSLTTTL